MRASGPDRAPKGGRGTCTRKNAVFPAASAKLGPLLLSLRLVLALYTGFVS